MAVAAPGAVTLLIDPPMWPAHGRRWSHLASDSSLVELHRFAVAMGIPERGFEGDHYDVPEERYADLVAAGALPVTSRELIRRLQGSGLRRPKRRGERVLTSRADLQAGQRVDSVLSRLAPPGGVDAVHLVVFRSGELLVEPDGEGYLLPRGEVRRGQPVHEVAAALAEAVLSEPALSEPALSEPMAVEPMVSELEPDVAVPSEPVPVEPAGSGPGPAGRWPAGAVAQLGYLRRVPAGRAFPPVGFEVVLRWPDLPARRVVVPDPLSWVPVEQAIALLTPELSALVSPWGRRDRRGWR